MKYKAHIVGGLVVGAFAMHHIHGTVHTLSSAAFILTSGFGALLPDLDHESSYLGHRVKPLSRLIRGTFGHRGATHAPLLILLLFFLLHFLTGARHLVFIGLMVGALSHVLLDALTLQGVPLLYPFRRQKISLFCIRTGGRGEALFTLLMLPLLLHLLLQ